jgi:hypothetical protein
VSILSDDRPPRARPRPRLPLQRTGFSRAPTCSNGPSAGVHNSRMSEAESSPGARITLLRYGRKHPTTNPTTPSRTITWPLGDGPVSGRVSTPPSYALNNRGCPSRPDCGEPSAWTREAGHSSGTYMVIGLAGTMVEWSFRRATSTSGGTSRRSTTSRDPTRRTCFAAFSRRRRGPTMTSQCFRFAQTVAVSWSMVEPGQPGSSSAYGRVTPITLQRRTSLSIATKWLCPR